MDELIPVGPSWLNNLSSEGFTLDIDESDLIPTGTYEVSGETTYEDDSAPLPPETEGMPASQEEQPRGSFSIPLVDADLRAEMAAQRGEEEDTLGPRVSTSFTDSGPSASGRPTSTGGGVQQSSGGRTAAAAQDEAAARSAREAQRAEEQAREEARAQDDSQREAPRQPAQRETTFSN